MRGLPRATPNPKEYVMHILPWRERGTTMRPEFASLFDPFFNDEWFSRELASGLPQTFRRGPLPPVNLADSEKEFTATVELPGLDEKDIQVQLVGDQLVISGERKWEQEQKHKEFYRVESQYGAFRRAIELPEGLRTDPDAINASYAKGVLEIRIPKIEPRPAAKITVKSK
jgi:HSP20 family protein